MRLRRRTTMALPAALITMTSLLSVPGAAAAATPTGGAVGVLARMSLSQRVGQLFMVGGAATGVGASTVRAVGTYHAGSVILTGRSTLGVTATRRVTNGLQALATGSATAGVPLFVGTDQEGGYVQVLQGTGFSRMPTALSQGSQTTATLRANARKWGGQLRSAGVNMNLAPVLDTVATSFAPSNPPIGRYDREYGHTPGAVASHGVAFAQGMLDAGVAVTGKHFPGLGRVTANPDTSSGVTDTQTTGDDPYLQPYAAAVHADVPVMMISSAYYSRIDPNHPGVFSSTVVTAMLRGDLGFRGLVVSDDLGNAEQVAAWSPGARAVDFLEAGGDVVLTVNPDLLPAMYGAVLARAESSSSFHAVVDAAALRVLVAKQSRGLIRPSAPGDFTGDGRTDPAVYRPSNGYWYVHGMSSVRYGNPGDVPVPGDYVTSSRTDIAVWRPSTGEWWVRGHGVVATWGVQGDVPVPADYTGDGVTDVAVWRPETGEWWVRGHGVVAVRGDPGDVPVPGDYDGDGDSDVAVWRPSTGEWWIDGDGVVASWGLAGDVPVAVDYHGDGFADLAVYRPSTGRWYVRGTPSVRYGEPGDIPTPGDYYGHGRLDISVWRPSTGEWWVRGHGVVATWGVPGDIPAGRTEAAT